VEPSSGLHRHGSCSNLKQLVEEINVFFQEVSATISGLEEFAGDLQLGYKGIVRVAPPPQPTGKALEKPSLNTEDLDL
jgi:hypothetical protein